MLSMSIHSGIKGSVLPCPSFPPSQNPIVGPIRASCSLLPQKPSSTPQKFLNISFQKSTPVKRIGSRLYASQTAEAEVSLDDYVEEDEDEDETPIEEEFKTEKLKLVLKFIWMEKNIGIGLDQEIKGHGRVPLSPYFFWPRKDAWEELKTTLESKPWISQKMMIILLNQATDIINLWQQSGGNLTS